MQGVEVFESVGAAAEELKPKDAILREAAGAASHAALPVACAEGTEAEQVQEAQLGEAEWCARTSGGIAYMPSLGGPDFQSTIPAR